MAFKRLEEKRKKAAEEARDEFLKDQEFGIKLRKVFGSSEGIVVLDWILDQCGVLDTIFTGNSQTFYNSGRQDFGNDLLARITKADPGIYHRLIDIWTKDIEERKIEAMKGFD